MTYRQILIYAFLWLLSSNALAANSAPSMAYLPNRGQADAFVTAAEVASAFGVYMSGRKDTNFDYKEANAKVNDCVKNPSSCSESEVFKSLIQYNLNKEASAMVIRNRTNALNLQTLDGHGIPKDKSASSLAPPRQPFKIQIDKDFGAEFVDEKKLKEQEILGQDFVKAYRLFVDAYSKPKEQNYIQVKKEFNKVTGREEEVMVTQNGGEQVDKAAFERDNKIQSAKAISDEANSLKDNVKAPSFEKQKDNSWAVVNAPDRASLGFKDPVDEATAKKYAQELNNSIQEDLNEQQKNADKTANGGIQYSMASTEFNKFLNEIWPPAAGAKPQ